MEGNRIAAPALQFLSSWKEIASYLGKGVRTVQRYEHEFGLPVRRPARRGRGSVIATKIEIDAWVMASPLREVYLLARNKRESNLSVVQNLNANAGKMFKLCEEMIALRSELQTMRYQLRESVSSIRKELRNQENPSEPSREDTAVADTAVSLDPMVSKRASTRVH
jgi:hypothetical protein